MGCISQLWVPDYSTFHCGCHYCGKIISQVRDTVPVPCYVCNHVHYCSQECLVMGFRTGHRRDCSANLDAEIDMSGAETLTAAQALWDLRKYTIRWHDLLGDAAVAALNLHVDPGAMDRVALVIHLSYVTRQPYRMRRFRVQYTSVEPLARLVGTTMNAAVLRREEYNARNQDNGMVGCALIVLACNVPAVGFIFNSTFVGPEPNALLDPPPPDWLERFKAVVKKSEHS